MDTGRNGQIPDILSGGIDRAGTWVDLGGNTGKGYVHDSLLVSCFEQGWILGTFTKCGMEGVEERFHVRF